MKIRPNLNKNLDEDIFRSFYYLKQELADFCRENNLQTTGGKEELTDRIVKFLETGECVKNTKIIQKRNIIRTKIIKNDIIEDNFVCSEVHRKFFKDNIGKSFSFKVKFQTWLKENPGKTYDDAIKCWNYKKSLPGDNKYHESDWSFDEQISK